VSTTEPLSPRPNDELRAGLGRVRKLALTAGGAGLGLCLLAALVPMFRLDVFRPYLAAYGFWFGLSLGGVALTMLHHLTGGSWGLVIRRPLEAAAITLIPMALLFLPIAASLYVGPHRPLAESAAGEPEGAHAGHADPSVNTYALYPWTDHAFVEHHEAVEHKAGYLSPGPFLLRTVGYFAVWIVIALLLNAWSRQQDRREDRAPSSRLANLSGPGLGIVFLTTTFACVDWFMSLEPDWYSTIYGPMLICGWGLATFAGATLVAAWMRPKEPELARVAGPVQFNDLGNLMLAFTMLWAYCSFMQYLIIWCGNLTEEIPWYLRRTRGGWEWFALVLIVFHFFAPFLVLLMRDVKRRPEILKWVALGILGVHLIDMAWLILPSQYLNPLDTAVHPVRVNPVQVLMVLIATAGIGGIWLAVFAWRLAGAPIVPRNDPAIDHVRTHGESSGNVPGDEPPPGHIQAQGA
jgi:hypothetical protein